MIKRWKKEALPFAAALGIILAGVGIHTLMAQALPEAPAPFLWLWLPQLGTLCGVVLFETVMMAYGTTHRGVWKLTVYLFLTVVIAVAVCWNVPRLYPDAPGLLGCLVLHLIGALFGTTILACCISADQPLPTMPYHAPVDAEVEVVL